MKKIIFPLLSFLVLACSTEAEEILEDLTTDILPNEESTNSLPEITSQQFSIAEHSPSGTSIGTITATDAEGDALVYSINSESELEINENSGDITLGPDLILDYETATSLMFTITVNDGTSSVDQEFELSINDIDEYELLNDTQKEIIAYFQYLTLFQSPIDTTKEDNDRWQEPMRIFLDGSSSAEFVANVEEVINEFNIIFDNSDFNMTIVDTVEESNAHVFFGEVADVEALWEDMFAIINGKTYSGFNMTRDFDSVITETRIWVSNDAQVLLKHELGHALGLGHSSKCEADKSFMCSSFGLDNDFLELEKEILKLAYDNDMPAGLSELEISAHLANQMVLGL